MLHDSHAEVLCVRALRRYFSHPTHVTLCSLTGEACLAYRFLLCEMLRPNSEVVEQCTAASGASFALRDVTFHLYISQAPCGDAAIFKLDCTATDDALGKRSTPSTQRTCKRQKLEASDLNRTGAKAVAARGSQKRTDVPSYNQAGLLRTKSGRSDLPKLRRTTSMSCSDKIALWNVVGVQGALVASLLDSPVYLTSITTSIPAVRTSSTCESTSTPNAEAAKVALHRAVYGRLSGASLQLPPGYTLHQPDVLCTEVSFPGDRPSVETRSQEQAQKVKIRPSGDSS